MAAGLATIAMASGAYGQAPAVPSAADSDDLKARIERLEKQNQELMQLLKNQQVIQAQPSTAPAGDTAVRKIVGDYLKEQEAAKKKADDAKKEADDAKKKEAEEKGHEVGSDLKLGLRWNPSNGVTFESEHKDFVSHIGVRFQLDNVWWDQSGGLRANPGAGIGDLQDGVLFRRFRPSWDGTAWEVLEWNVELALEQTVKSVPTFDEVWVGLKELPLIGSLRIGHLKVPQGFEGDMVSSSKAMTFLERSAYTDAFYENFGTGVQTTNSVMDQRATMTAMVYRMDNDNGINADNTGAVFEDGRYAYGARLTALPLWQEDGRCWLHLGTSFNWRDAEIPTNNGAGVVPGGDAGAHQARFRARPQMRDAIGDWGNIPNSGNSQRLVDTGAVGTDGVAVIGTELCYVRGPFSLQAEYAFSAMDDVVTLAGTNVFPGTAVGSHLGAVWFHGGYVQASYFLTGENRAYDRRLGREASTYIASPYENFYLVRGEDRRWLFGRGAWEVACRLNHLDLNSDKINGGETNAVEAGLNWYLSNNMKLQFMYLYQTRFNMKAGVNPGSLDGLGIRTQFFF